MVTLRGILLFLVALVYVISPVDAIPDFLPGLGWVDDLAAVGLLAWVLIAQHRGQSP